jgi:uncharacterized protein (TIGR03435 family)
VASIKPNTSLSTNQSINFAPGGQLNCTNVSLRLLLTFAYDVRDYQLVNVPGWAAAEHYDVFAKPALEDIPHEPPEHSTAGIARLRSRTQALLADRFGLVLHTENREVPVYHLVVAKGGPKLGDPKPAESVTATGPDGPQISWNNTKVTCKNVTMQRFAEVVLSSRMGHDVVDKTGLTGAYAFRMEFVPDEGPPKNSGDTVSVDPGPSFLSALREQLGLRLETGKGQVPFLVIDKLERLSPN